MPRRENRRKRKMNLEMNETLLGRLQLMAIIAMLLTLFTGHTTAFIVAMLMLTGLKLYTYHLYRRMTDAVFTVIYLVMLTFIIMEK